MSNKLVRKNIDLPKWVVDIIDEQAAKLGNKFKPYVEWRLTRSAQYEKARKENPLPRTKPSKAKQ